MEKLEIKEGVAVKSTPDVQLAKDDVLAIKDDLTIQIMNCESQILVNQNNLNDLNKKLIEVQAVITELGYEELT